MTIENWDEYKSNLWDWGILDGCFMNTKIKPTDIDGFVERNGRFLVIETKSPNTVVKLGQEITFRRLVETGIFTVMIVWGNAGIPQKIRLMTNRATEIYPNSSLENMRKIVNKWFIEANKSSIEKR